MKIFFCVFICLMLTGCAAVSDRWVYDPESIYADSETGLRLAERITSKGAAMHKHSKGDEVFESDSKVKSPLEGMVKCVGQEVMA